MKSRENVRGNKKRRYKCVYIYIYVKRKVIWLRPKCAAGPAPSVIPALYRARRRPPPCTSPPRRTLPCMSLLYYCDDAGGLINPIPPPHPHPPFRHLTTRTVLIDFCSRKITALPRPRSRCNHCWLGGIMLFCHAHRLLLSFVTAQPRYNY